MDITSVLGENLAARVDLHAPRGARLLSFPVEGTARVPVPVGDYDAFVYVYDDFVPILTEFKPISVEENGQAHLLVNVLEGTGGNLTLKNFDRDGDLVVDRVELEYGTDAEDAADVPGEVKLPYSDAVLRTGSNWYRGDLHTYSNYSGGGESVAELVRRAERAGLDFLAITDLNTVQHLYDPGYESSQLVLIPAMSWGNEVRGKALIYGMRTEPTPPGLWQDAQANCYRVQAQGGIFAIAHPAFREAPWQWGLEYVNAVEVWSGPWRAREPLALSDLSDALRERKDGALVHSIAAAAASGEKARARISVYRSQVGGAGAAPDQGVSANGQSALFWDYELVRGLRAGAIGGSASFTSRDPIASPVTYILARELSLPALLEGLRMGRTYVSSGVDGPRLDFRGDSLGDGTIDVQVGGVVPLNLDVRFYIGVMNAVGKKLDVIRNGRPIYSLHIDVSPFSFQFQEKPEMRSAYRIRVVGSPANPRVGHGPMEVYAMSSPIYAEDITQQLLQSIPDIDPSRTWVRIESDGTAEQPELDLPGF